MCVCVCVCSLQRREACRAKETNQNSDRVNAACPKFGSPALSDTLTKVWAGRQRKCVPAAPKDLSILQSIQTESVVYTDSSLMGTGTYFREGGVERQGREVYRSSPPSAEVKKL